MTLNSLFPHLAGKHQIENAATAVSVVKSIKQIVIDNKIIKKGIENVFWPGECRKSIMVS